jgi:ribosomal protein L27
VGGEGQKDEEGSGKEGRATLARYMGKQKKNARQIFTEGSLLYYLRGICTPLVILT